MRNFNNKKPEVKYRQMAKIRQIYASAVNFYNATGSLARFENKNVLFYF
jgi:hypothetical protein